MNFGTAIVGRARPSATGWEKGSYVHYPIFEGWKRYELANHLGNVLAVITDRKRGNAVSGTAIQWFEADVVAAQQYYPFGMLMPGNASAALRRQYTLNSYDYRYGFNGKEGDDEIKGDDNQQDYGMRIYDPRVARFLSVDPIAKEFRGIRRISLRGTCRFVQWIWMDWSLQVRTDIKLRMKD